MRLKIPAGPHAPTLFYTFRFMMSFENVSPRFSRFQPRFDSVRWHTPESRICPPPPSFPEGVHCRWSGQDRPTTNMAQFVRCPPPTQAETRLSPLDAPQFFSGFCKPAELQGTLAAPPDLPKMDISADASPR